MLNPSVRLVVEEGILVADFWDCLRLDPEPVRDLKYRYESHVKAGGRPDLVVDFNGVGFAGSAALTGFLTLQKACRALEGRLILCNLEPEVFDSFRLSRLNTLFTFADTKAEALAKLNSGPSLVTPESGNGHSTASKDQPASAPLAAPPLRLRRRKA